MADDQELFEVGTDTEGIEPLTTEQVQGDLETAPATHEEKKVEAEATTEGEEKPSAPQFKYKSHEEAEKAYSEAVKKMTEATEKASRYEKMLSTVQPIQPVAQPTKSLVDRVQEKVNQKIASLTYNESDPSSVKAYNDAVQRAYWEGNQELTQLTVQEGTARSQRQAQMTTWIEAEAKKYGIDDTPITLKNEDGTEETGSMKNVFWGIARDPSAFGINVQGMQLPDQVRAVAHGINRFVDAVITMRAQMKNETVEQKKSLTVLGRGGQITKKRSTEPEILPTLADAMKEARKGRRVRQRDLE